MVALIENEVEELEVAATTTIMSDFLLKKAEELDFGSPER